MGEYIPGETIHIRFVPTTGGTVDIQAKYRSLKVTSGANTVDITSGADAWQRFLVGKKNWSVSYEGFQNGEATPLGTTDINLLAPGVTGVLTISPFGTAVGKSKLSGTAIIENRDLDYPYEDAAKLALSFKGSDALTPGAW